MADLAGPLAQSGSPLAIPRRSGRVAKASSKALTALNTFGRVTADENEIHLRDARHESIDFEFETDAESREARSYKETGKNTVQKMVELLEKSYEELKELEEETKELKQKVTEQTLAIAKQDELIGNLNNTATQQGSSIKELQQELRDATAELTEVRVQLDTFTVAASHTAGSSSQATYAEIARTPPGSAPSNIRTLSSGITTPSTETDTLYCTIDYSRVTVEDGHKVTAGAIRSTLEREIRTEQESATWRCRAVTKDCVTDGSSYGWPLPDVPLKTYVFNKWQGRVLGLTLQMYSKSFNAINTLLAAEEMSAVEEEQMWSATLIACCGTLLCSQTLPTLVSNFLIFLRISKINLLIHATGVVRGRQV